MPTSDWPTTSARFHLRTSDGHCLHVCQCGPDSEEPWLVLHGGPGSGCAPSMVAWFDLLRHRVVLPDQRGAGRSRPAGTLRRNTVTALLADLEQLRIALGIARRDAVGGSWGAALALAHADRFPHTVSALVLRGTFLTGFDDVQSSFNARGVGCDLLRGVGGRGEGFPVARGRLRVTTDMLQPGTAVQKLNITMAWQRVERRLLDLWPLARHQTWQQCTALVCKYQLQAHHLHRRAGLGKAALLRATTRIGARGLPVTLLHGWEDKACRSGNVLRLSVAIPHMRLVWVPGGHLAAGEMAEVLGAAIHVSAWSVGV